MNRRSFLKFAGSLLGLVTIGKNIDKLKDVLDNQCVDGDVQPHIGYQVGHILPPAYSTDITAAWEVVNKMVNDTNISITIGGQNE